MDRLRERVEQELDVAAVVGRPISDLELVARLAPEFSSVCGQTDVRAAVAMAMRQRRQYRASMKVATNAGTLSDNSISRWSPR
jgi:hypothetical protein